MVDGGVEDEGEAAGADGAKAPEELAQDAHPGKITISVAFKKKTRKETQAILIATPPKKQK